MREGRGELLPCARQDELVVRELPDEILVYDLRRDKAHCLNKASAFVWKHCDGKMPVAKMTRLLEREFGAPVEDDVIWLALSQLRRFHLLEEESRISFAMKVTRRDLVRKYLPAALVLPVILSIPAPTAAQSTSGACAAPNNRPNGCACTSGPQCASGCCNAGTCQAACP